MGATNDPSRKEVIVLSGERAATLRKQIGRMLVASGIGLVAFAYLQPGGFARLDFRNSIVLILLGIGILLCGGAMMRYDPACGCGLPGNASVLVVIENLFGGLFCLFLAMTVGGFCIMEFLSAFHNKQDLLPRRLALSIPIACVPLDLWFIVVLISQWARSPIALSMAVAARLPLLPRLFRPLLAAVWLGHFLAGAIFVMQFEKSVSPGTRRPLELTLSMLLLLGLMYASNTFLLAAVGALTRRPAVLAGVWRLRILVDVCVAFGFPMIVRFG